MVDDQLAAQVGLLLVALDEEFLRAAIEFPVDMADGLARVIKTMLDFGYLNDARYTTEFLIYDLGRGRSLKKAFFDLRQKGVSEEDIQSGYNEYLDEFGEPDDHKAAYDEALKVLTAADLEPGHIPDDMRQKISGRIARRLFTRGFSQSLIYDVLREITSR